MMRSSEPPPRMVSGASAKPTRTLHRLRARIWARKRAEEIAGPAVALTRAEQRELLAALRALRAAAEAGPSGERPPEVAGSDGGDAAPEGGNGAADGPTAETVAEMDAVGSLVAPVRDYEDRTGGIALDAEGYDEPIRRLRALEGRQGLPEKWEAGSRWWLDRDALSAVST